MEKSINFYTYIHFLYKKYNFGLVIYSFCQIQFNINFRFKTSRFLMCEEIICLTSDRGTGAERQHRGEKPIEGFCKKSDEINLDLVGACIARPRKSDEIKTDDRWSPLQAVLKLNLFLTAPFNPYVSLRSTPPIKGCPRSFIDPYEMCIYFNKS